MTDPERIVLAVDVGSSSIRCSAYRINIHHLVEAVENCSVKQEARTVQPNTGRILNLTPNDDANNSETSLFDQIDSCVDETLQLLRQRSKQENVPFFIVGVGFSTFVMNLVGVDRDGQVIGEVASMSYACNTAESSEYCRKLKSQLDQELLDSLYQSTGAPLHSAYALVQLGAFYSNPENQDICQHRIAKWQTIASICLGRWVGVDAANDCLPISWSEASWTGLLNFKSCRYEPTALQLLPEKCQNALPRVADLDGTSSNHDNDDDDQISRLVLQGGMQALRRSDGTQNPYWDRWPELRGYCDTDGTGCRLFLGIGDGACANIGSKCSDNSRIAVTVGTSAAARVCIPLGVKAASGDDIHGHDGDIRLFTVPRGLFCYRINQHYVLLGGALTDGGSVVEWVSSLTNLTATPRALEDCMAQVQVLFQSSYDASSVVSPDSSSNDAAAVAATSNQPHLTMIPFFSGERSTGFRDGATGVMLGLTRETTAAHLLQACLEGVTLRINAIINLIRTVLAENNNDDLIQIVSSGKALEVNQVWRQILADCSGLNVVWDDDIQEATSRGVALLIASSISKSQSSSDTSQLPQEALSSSSQITFPKLSATHVYWRRAGERQELLIDTVTPLFGA